MLCTVMFIFFVQVKSGRLEYNSLFVGLGVWGSLIISPLVVREIRRKETTGRECGTYEKGNPWMILVRETEGKSPLGRCRHRGRSNSKVVLK